MLKVGKQDSDDFMYFIPLNPHNTTPLGGGNNLCFIVEHTEVKQFT